MAEMGVVGRMDSGAYRPSLEIPEGEHPDLLQCLLASTVARLPMSPAFHVETPRPEEAGAIGDRSAEDTRIVGAIGGASPAFGLVTSMSAPPPVIPFVELCAEGRIALPLVERSTRYTVLLIFFTSCLSTLSSCLGFVYLRDVGNPFWSLRS